jgi:hypothetical protein
MPVAEVMAILAFVGWSVYRQAKVTEVTAGPRFRLAVIYAAIGVAVDGFDLPTGLAGVTMIVVGLALSLVVGLLRGRLTRVWADEGGRVFSQGTTVTVALFVGLVIAKFGIGTAAYFAGIDDGAGFGEVLVMTAIMIAVQSELVWRRAKALNASSRVVVATL